ncbi:MAG: hypothetical protein ACOH2E_06980 [Candidatus Paracaedibacter sp.]
MFKNILQTLLITVTASASLMADDAATKDVSKPTPLECPTMKEANLKTLAETGKIDLNGKSFRLVSEQEIINNYNKSLIGSQSDLQVFLTKSTSTLTVTRYINSHRNAMMKNQLKKHCPYTLERESDIAVIAIVPTS